MEENSAGKMVSFGRAQLQLDAASETERIVAFLQQSVTQKLHRQGAVVGISGGVDSSVVLALCARAFGPQRVMGILLPEKESSPESADLAYELAACFGVETVMENISAALEGAGCYQRRDEAIQRIIPEYHPGWAMKIVLPGDLLERATMNLFQIVVTAPDGQEYRKRLPPVEFRQIVASSNFKQRMRMSMLYYHAELRNYAVIGTAQKNERDLGFFVKYGDGGTDVNPITHLYKSQVFQLARYLGVPESICQRTPTTDTYPGGSTQEEFFYRIPFEMLDTIWLGFDSGAPNAEIAQALDLTENQVENVVKDIISKRQSTAYLRLPPLGIGEE